MAKSASDEEKNKFTLLIYDLINIKSNDALKLHSFAVGVGCGGRQDERKTLGGYEVQLLLSPSRTYIFIFSRPYI